MGPCEGTPGGCRKGRGQSPDNASGGRSAAGKPVPMTSTGSPPRRHRTSSSSREGMKTSSSATLRARRRSRSTSSTRSRVLLSPPGRDPVARRISNHDAPKETSPCPDVRTCAASLATIAVVWCASLVAAAQAPLADAQVALGTHAAVATAHPLANGGGSRHAGQRGERCRCGRRGRVRHRRGRAGRFRARRRGAGCSFSRPRRRQASTSTITVGQAGGLKTIRMTRHRTGNRQRQPSCRGPSPGFSGLSRTTGRSPLRPSWNRLSGTPRGLRH